MSAARPDAARPGGASAGRGVIGRLAALVRGRSGAGAVEFALVAPVLIILYVGALEISVAMTVNKKVSRASSTIADLVTQQTTVDKAFLSTMVDVAESILSPFHGPEVTLKVTAIEIDGSKNAKVKWSWDDDGGRPHAVNSTIAVPNELKNENTFLVRAELSYPHTLLLVMPGADSLQANQLTMEKTYFLRQRIGSSVKCSNC